MWPQVELGEVVTLQRGYDLPERERSPGQIPVVSSSGISGFHSIAKVQGPGVVTGRYGTLGQVYYIQEDFWPHNTTLFVKDYHGNDRRFAYYLLSSLDLAHESAVSAVPGVNRNTLHRLKVNLPPLDSQRRIAEILGRLDDKIEVNRRINRTLEQMAQALYKHWFVDFGPFQDGGFVESELGPIPKGWRVGKLQDLFILQRGFDLPKDTRKDGIIPVISASGLTGTHIEAKVKGPGVVTGRSGSIGGVYYVVDDFWPLNTTLWIKEYRISKPVHAFQFLKTIDLLSFNSGSAVPTLNRNHINDLPVVLPAENVVAQFEDHVAPFYVMKKLKEKESITLVKIRNYLLPKLLSGEIEVSHAEEMTHA